MVAERLIAPVLKTGVRLRGPGVQIPPIPPFVLSFYARRSSAVEHPWNLTDGLWVRLPDCVTGPFSSVVEHLTCNEVAVGSTPTEGSTFC